MFKKPARAITGSLKILLFVSLVFFTSPAISQDSDSITERFSEFDEESTVQINHLPLSEILNETIFPVGNSRSRLGNKGKRETYKGSHIISTPTGKPSRYEGNRLMIHAFDNSHASFFTAYQEGLENLSERRPLSTLNKDEQLAYWLNLYNVIVINKLITEYPVKKLKSWRVSKKGSAYWDEKVTQVEGIPLSLRDIELIVFNNWDQPLVMYGFFQGSIGGPNLPTEAYSSENVWRLLSENAVEFTNSNRGVRVKGSRLDVSLMYEWALPLFDHSEDRVLSHIQAYAYSGFHGDLSNVTSVRFKTYNWLVADLVGGNLHKGQHNQFGGILVAGSGRANSASTPGRDPGKVNIETHNTFGRGGPSSPTGFNFMRDMIGFSELLNRTLGYEPVGPQLALPPQALELIENILIHNNTPKRIPEITIIDCEKEGGCVEVPVTSGPAENAGPDSQPNEGGPAWMLTPLASG